MNTTTRGTTVICPKCGEDNADNFRFCGMCGAVLERATPASGPKVERVRDDSIPVALTIPANPPRTRTEKRVEPISGPSILGLGPPTVDSLREKAFSSSGPFFEVEEPKTGGRKIVLLLLLAALGAAAWWTYTNYIAIGKSEKQAAAVSNPGANQLPAEKPATQQPATETKSADAAPTNPAPTNPAQSGGTPAQAPENPAAKADANPANVNPSNGNPSNGNPENVNPENKSDTAETAAAAPHAVEKAVKGATVAKADRSASTRSSRKAALAAKAAAPPAEDTGEADFRRGEAYLYGRGARENCGEAIKYLKAASGKLHARARSTFGTMYATGHCVPRDLPTSYSWFALALQVDPNNQILEKDLTAVWNQMTPPERQLATRMKQ
jgi:hypothetical protein